MAPFSMPVMRPATPWGWPAIPVASGDATLFRSIQIASHGTLFNEISVELPAVHVIWLGAATRLNFDAISAELKTATATQSPESHSFPFGKHSLLEQPSAIFLLVGVSSADLGRGASRVKALLSDSQLMIFEQKPASPLLSGAVQAALEALGLASLIPEAAVGRASLTLRI